VKAAGKAQGEKSPQMTKQRRFHSLAKPIGSTCKHRLHMPLPAAPGSVAGAASRSMDDALSGRIHQ
jgi:hypothetical protein